MTGTVFKCSTHAIYKTVKEQKSTKSEQAENHAHISHQWHLATTYSFFPTDLATVSDDIAVKFVTLMTQDKSLNHFIISIRKTSFAGRLEPHCIEYIQQLSARAPAKEIVHSN